MSESSELWTFSEGLLRSDESVKGYTVVATDGELGTCAWADYKPGESYLVVTHRHILGRDDHYLVPAGAVVDVDRDSERVTINVTGDQVRGTPPFDNPEAAYSAGMVDQFERGMLGGGFVWPYTDV